MIFPPFMGVTLGENWMISFLGFVLADVGIIILSINQLQELALNKVLFFTIIYLLTAKPKKVMDIIGKVLTFKN